MAETQALIFYLQQTLGVNYLPKLQAEPEVSVSEAPTQSGPPPKLIFLNYDDQDVTLKPEQQDVFDKIVKAMGLEQSEIWWVQGNNQSFNDVLNRFRLLKIESPVVVMKKDPEIFDHLQQTGSHLWAECFSISEMMKNPNLKKTTWRILQYFLKKG